MMGMWVHCYSTQSLLLSFSISEEIMIELSSLLNRESLKTDKARYLSTHIYYDQILT